LFVITVLALFFISGCGGGTGTGKQPVEIKVAFWGGPDEINIITDIINTWQKDNPDIKVRLEHTPYRGYVDKLLTRIAGGAAPDVICTEVDLFVTFQTKGVLLPLDEYIDNDETFSIEQFFPSVMRRFTVNGKVYCIPRDTAPFACVFYNKDMFDEANIPYPDDNWDWYDMLDKAKKLTKTDVSGRNTEYGFYGWAWQNFVYSNGGKLVDDVQNPTECLLNSEKTKEGLRFYTALINDHKVMPSPVDMANLAMGVQQMFATGRLAMFSSGIWETPFLRSIKRLRWDVAMFPKGPEGERGFGTGGSGYCILASTEHPKEAWEVVKALSGPEGQKILAKRGLAQPALISIAEGEYWAQSDELPLNKKMLNEAVEYVVYAPFHTKWREARGLHIDREFDLLFNGKETVDEAVEKLVPKVNALLRGQE
jgi:ABC-type glycerol-3-phosphate transport system substrate-binding protein